MPAAAIFPVMPPTSRRGEEMSSGELRVLDQQLQQYVPEYITKIQFQLPDVKRPRPDASPTPSQTGDRPAVSEVYYVTLASETADDVVMHVRGETTGQSTPYQLP